MMLKLQATPEEVMRGVEALQEFARRGGLGEKDIFALCLGLEECGSNIVNHALQRNAGQTFQVLFEHTAQSFVIELRDHGPAFDPTVVVERKPEAADEDIPGGWGIQLVRRYMDEIRYAREAGENVLRLTKRVTGTNAEKI
jgi:serine/threonine-protein kinase RsbW